MSKDIAAPESTKDFSDEFSGLIRPHLEVLRRVALKLTRDPSDAEDLLQDVLLKLYQNRARLGQIEILKPWLLRVMRNLFIDQRRHAALEPTLVSISQMGSASDSEGADEASVEDFDCKDEAPGPEKAVYWQQLGSAVSDALQRLPVSQSMPVVLHLVDGLTVPEVAAQMHAPVNTVKSNLRRALDGLRLGHHRRAVAADRASAPGSKLTDDGLPRPVAAAEEAETDVHARSDHDTAETD